MNVDHGHLELIILISIVLSKLLTELLVILELVLVDRVSVAEAAEAAACKL